MKDEYAKYEQNFLNIVAKNDALPKLYKGKPMELMPDDDDEFVQKYLDKLRKGEPFDVDEI